MCSTKSVRQAGFVIEIESQSLVFWRIESILSSGAAEIGIVIGRGGGSSWDSSGVIADPLLIAVPSTRPSPLEFSDFPFFPVGTINSSELAKTASSVSFGLRVLPIQLPDVSDQSRPEHVSTWPGSPRVPR